MKANEKNVVRLLAASLVGFAFAVSSAFADATAVPFDWFSEPTANEVSTGGLSSATWSATAKGSPLSLREVAWFENDKLNVDVDYSEAAQQSLTFTPAPAAYDGEQVFTASLNFLAAYDSKDDLPPVGDSKAGIALVKHEDGGVCFAFISKLDTVRAWSVSGPVVGASVEEPIGVRVTRKSDGTLVYEYKNSSVYAQFGVGGTVSEKITSSSFYGSGLVNSFVGTVNVSGVALMDGVLYPTVADAFAAATNNAVIKLLADCEFNPTAGNIAKKNVKIDTDGHTFDLGAGASDAAKLKGLKIVKSGEGVIELATAIPFDGSGTEAAPWQLGTNEDLWYFMYGVNAGTYGTNGEHFVQTNNLDFTEEAPWPGIGSEYDEKGDKHLGFSGTYDGDGWAITGLKFANNATGNKYRGFFNQIYNATVKNLWVDTVGFEEGMSGEYGGAAVVGCMNASVVSNCVAEGELSGTHNCGGVVGRIGVSGKIIDCKNQVEISCSYTKIGGIAVIAQNIADDGEVLIQGCVNTESAKLTATEGNNAGADGVAGIIAYTSCGHDNQLKIVDCVNKCNDFVGYTNSTLAQIVGKINSNRIKGEGENKILGIAVPAVGSVRDKNATYADGLCFAMEEPDEPPMLLQSQTFNKAGTPDFVLVSSNDFEVGGTYYVEAPITSIAFNGLKEVGDFIKFDRTLSPTFMATVTLADDAAPGLTVIGSIADNVLTYTVGYETYTIGYYMPDKTEFTAWMDGYIAPTTFTAENTVTLPTAANVDSQAFTLTGWTNSLGVAVATTAGAYSNLVLYANVEAQTYVVRVPAVKGVDCAVTNQSGAVSGSKVGDFWTYEVTYGDKADVYLTPADGYLFEDGTSVKKISYDNITGPVTVPASDIPTPVKAPDLKEWFYGLIETGWPTKAGMKGAWSASAGEIGDIANFTGSAVEISTDDAALVFTPDDKHSFATDTTIIKSTVSYTVMALADLPEDLTGLKAGLTLVATDSAPAYYGIVKKSGEDANEWQKLTVLGDGEDGESVDVVIELKTVDGVAKVRYTVGDEKTDFLDLYVTESKVNDVAYTGDGVVAKLDGIIETVVNGQTITIGEPLPEGIGEVQVTTNGAAVVGEGGVYKVESGADVRIVFLPASGKILVGNTTYNIEGIDQNIVFGEGEYQFPTAEDVPTGLRFTAVGGDVQIGMKHYEWGDANAAPDWKLEWYKVPGSSEWTPFDPTNSVMTVSEGETAYFRLLGDTPIDTLSFNGGDFMSFTMTTNEPGVTVEAGGNVMSLLDKTCEKKTLGEYAFIGLFDGCDVLTSAPTLPATNVAKYCYNCMFKGCSSLTNAPALPVKDLTDCNNCYEAMFRNCTALKTAPELPATNLATGCYWSMFQNCTSLTAVPELPALYANGGAYKGMFWNCTSLTESLDMAATNGGGDGFAMMYYNCANLTAIKVTFTEWPNVGSIYDWVANVAPKGTFYCPEGLPAECDDENHSRIPTGWRVVRTTPGVVTLKVPKAPVAGHEHVSYYVSDGSAEAVGKVEGDYNVYDFSVGTNAYVNFVADEGYVLNDDKPNPCVKTMTAATTVLADEFPTAVEAVVVTVPGAENVTNRFYAVSVDGSVTNEVMAGESGYTMPKGWNYLVVYVPDEGYAIRGQTEFFGGPVTESGALDIEPPEAKEIRTITVVDGKDEAISNMTFIVTNLTAGALIEKKVVGEDATYEAVDGDTVKVVFTADAGYTIFGSSVIEYADIDEDKMIEGADLPKCIETPDYLSFTAVDNDVTISMTDGDEPLMLEWSFDKDASLEDWVEFDAIEGSNVVVAVGGTIYFRRQGADVADKLNWWNFVFETEGTVEAGGNVMSLLDRTCVSKTVGEYAFSDLFSDCAALTTAPELPAMELGHGCYSSMFSGCTALTNAPALPATNLTTECYTGMFEDCTSLTIAPALPATNLTTECYFLMFCRCASLTNAPALPATNLAESCYNSMFKGCTSLTTAPKLPATELVNVCYNDMFNGCTSLTTAPELPATTLASYCYCGMFGKCTSLTNAPALPATELAEQCYADMFYHCPALETAPALPAVELTAECYRNMFADCYSLNSVKVGFTNWREDADATTDWLAGVAPTGIFLCPPALEITRDGSHIPEGWLVNPQTFTVKTPLPEHITGYTMELVTEGSALVTNGTSYVVSTNDEVKITFTPEEGYDFVSGDGSITATISGSGIVIGEGAYPFPEVYKQDYLSFTARGGNVEIGMTWSKNDWDYAGEPNLVLLETAPSKDGPWTEFLANHSNVTVTAGNTVYFRRKGADTALTLNPTNAACYSFNMTAGDGVTVEADGNVMSLLDQTCRQTEVGAYAFGALFRLCQKLTTAPALPAKELAMDCYDGMFVACTALTDAPALPATNLAERCYCGMFDSCSSLTNAPALPATNLAENCYNGMFSSCSSLTDAPALPAMELAESCYDHMFSRCSSLTNAPALPAMELAESCYDHMFSICTSLTTAPALPAKELKAGCYASMFGSCEKLTVAPVLSATNLVDRCYRDMFGGCWSLTEAPELPVTELAEQCYFLMFQQCYALTSAPVLPATNLVKECYRMMFMDCTNLNSVTVGFTNWCEDVNATMDWLANVAPTGVFLCPPALDIKRGGSFIPEGWLANPQTFTVAALPEGVELKPFNLLTEGSAIYTNTFGFTDYAVSSNDLIELTFKTQDGYRFISGDDMLEGTVVTAKINKTDYVIGSDIPFPTATRVYTFDLPRSKGMINASYVVTNGTTDISDKHVDGIDSESWRYTVVTGTTTTITFAPYVPSSSGGEKKSFLRFPEVDGVLVTNPMVIAEISANHIYKWNPHETPYGVEAVDITIPGVSNMTYYVSNTTYAAETFYPDDCGDTNVFRIAKAEDTVFVFTPADGFIFDGATEAAKNPITVNTNVDYTIKDVEIPQVVRNMSTLRLEVIAGLDYVVTNKGEGVSGTPKEDGHVEYLIDRIDNTADIYFILADGYTTVGGYTNPLSTNVTEDVVTIGAGAPGMPKVVYWYKVQYTNGSETNQTDTVNQDAEYHISTNIYPKTGYTFLGWTNTEAEVALYVTNQVVVNLTTTPGGMVTLTTVYQPNAYTVKYTDGVEGSAVSNATYDVEFAISENVFEKTGHTFQYWTNETAEVGYMPGDIVSNLTAEADGEVVLTAVWAANEYKVKYVDGAGHEAVSNATYDVEFAISENVFEKTGYHFTGWTNEADNAVYLPGEIVSNLTYEVDGEYELKAIWVPNEYEVKYVANGGVGDDLYTTNTFDKSFNAATTNGFTKTGYHFTHWTNATHSIEAGGVCTDNLSDGDSVTLYAAWVANGYKLAYEPGADEGVAITNDCVYDVAFAVSNKVFSRTGYVQAGWTNLVKGIGYEFDQIVSNLTDEVDGVVVLTATWTPNAYTVKYTDGAGNAAVSNATYDVEFAISENVFEKTGYHFTGWTNETDNVGYQPGEIVSNLTDEVDGVYELTAIWVPNKYEVKYVANGGVGDDLYTTNTYDEAFIAAGADVFTKQGYTYNSWTNANGDVYTAGGECINLSTGDSVTLYAAWVANEYNLFYTPGDGEGTTVSNLLVYDQEYVVIDKPDDFVKEHYSFKCWTNATENGALYWPGDMISNLTDVAGADVYFDAVWTANVHTVTMPADVGQMTYVVSNETTGAEIEVTGNEFFASYGDDITIYFTANDGYMLVGDDTTLSFTVEGNKTINTDDLPCVPRIIIGDWSDTVGVTNIEWNATNLVNLINDKDKAVWVQFRYNFDDGSPILETLPEGFGFNFVGGEGEGYPATFETTPAAGGELRKVSITGVLNTFCTKKLPVNENYFIGDRLVYEPCQIDSTPDGVDTEIEVTWAFILGGTNTIITVGGTNENDGVVTIKANDIKRDGSVAMLELTDKGQIMTKVPTNLIVAARGYTLSISESPDSDGYYTYKAEKCGVVVYTTDVFGDLGDPIEMKIMDWDMPEDLLGEVKAWTSANPDKLATLVFNNDVIFSDGTVIPAGSEIWVIDNEWDVLTSEEEDAILTRDVQPGEAVYVYGNVAFTGNLLVGSTNDCYDTSITFWGDVSIDPAVEVGKTNGVAETYAKAVMYLYGTVAFDESAETKFTLHKNGMVISAAQLGTEIIACDDGCSSFELNDEYHGVWIYACRLSDAKLDVKPGEPFTVGDVEDEVAAAKIAADCMVISPDTEANEWLIASGMWVEYQKLFDLSAVSTGTPNEFQFTAQLKSSVSNEIAVALNAASAKIPDCLKVKTVMVETKPGVLYAVFSSETADGTYTRDDAWVIGTGKEVPVKFKVEGEARFYKVNAAFKRGDD